MEGLGSPPAFVKLGSDFWGAEQRCVLALPARGCTLLACFPATSSFGMLNIP